MGTVCYLAHLGRSGVSDDSEIEYTSIESKEQAR